MAKIAGFALLTLALLALAAALQGCGGAHAEESLTAEIRQATNSVPDPGLRWDPAHRGLRTIEAQNFTGIQPFLTVSRTAEMEAYPCSQCHNEPLSVLNARKIQDEPLSHWQVNMQHASDTFMDCQTCHGDGEMDELRLLSGKPVSFDASYQVCAQCHGKQEKEWAGGGHGKRLGGWAPPRVVETCAGCHNPHSPAFESRWPARHKKGPR